MVTAAQVVGLALTKAGYAYDTGPSRTTGADGYFDCSGFTYFLLEHLGVRPPDWQPQSHLQALYDRDHGLLLTVDKAIATVGALLYEGPDHAYIGGAGIPGHVAVSLGNGHTIEAMGHAWGTRVGNAFGRGWSNAGLFPNVDYSANVPTPPHPSPEDGPELQGDNMALVIPARAKVINGRVANYVLDVQSDHVFAYNGAQLKWRGGDPKNSIPTKLSDFLVYKIPTTGPHFGLTETDDPHTLLPNNILCVTAADGGCAFADMTYP